MIIKDIFDEFEFAKDFFVDNLLPIDERINLSMKDYVLALSESEIEDLAINIDTISDDFSSYLSMMKEFLGISSQNAVKSLTIIAGQNKLGEKEGFGSLKISTSEIVSIVGPTGSGKSRLLADIEWTANHDTPTNRSILINDEKPDLKWRYSTNNKLVAQLSQNMNFVMDLSVEDFLIMHAQSRHAEHISEVVEKILEEGNKLAGEAFSRNTAVTALSGGQSRALMIADTAILSSSPIILIDEIENAGIDRRKALELLVSEDKIVLMATHDPSLALMADKRIIINNGGIVNILETSDNEKQCLSELDVIDKKLQNLRKQLRYGERCTF